MATLTPTQSGSVIAGVGVWALIWATLFKVDKIPLVKNFVKKESILNWIYRNKVVTLLFTEILNFGLHGVEKPESALFALGGTLVNMTMIFGWIGIRQRTRGKDLRTGTVPLTRAVGAGK